MLDKNVLIFWVPILLRPKAIADVKTACIRTGVGIPTKIKMKNTRPKEKCKIQLPHAQIFYFFSCCFILAFTSEDIFLHKFSNFIQHYLKKIFFNGFTQPTPYLSPFSNAPDGTKIHGNLISL